MVKFSTVTIMLVVALNQPAMAQDTTASAEVPDQPAPSQATMPAAGLHADLYARDNYRIDPVICPFKGQIDYKPGEIECGLLEVPENRENPDSRFIELHFVKLHSRWGRDEDQEKDDAKNNGYQLAPGKRDDPVVYLTGGPGVVATDYVKRLKDHRLLDHRDLYILEQRGIGYSGDFCPFYSTRKPALGDVSTFAESLDAEMQRMRDCALGARAAGVDITAYNSIENARDVKALRRALGFEKWNVWGISYGSILGQAYIKEDPEGIRAVVIDAIMPLNILSSELYWRVAHWYDRDLGMLQDICDRQPACASRYPDIAGRLRKAVKSVVDNPIVADVKDTESFPSGKAHIFQDTVAFLPFMFFYGQDNFPAIPGLIYAWADAVERRDETLFRAIAAASGEEAFVSVSQGMHNAIICIDGDMEAQARAAKKDILEYPVLGPAGGSAEDWDRRAALCSELGMPRRSADEYLPVETNLPSLIVDGAMDPITPPPNAKAILPGFSNGSYVEFPYAGHGPSRSVKCAGDLLNAFYDDPAVKPNLACVDTMKEPRIYAPLYASSLVPRLLLRAVEDKKQLILPGVWAGASLFISLIAFLLLSFAPLARAWDRRQAVPAGTARLTAWLASASSVSAGAVVGAAFAVTVQTSELLPLFGLVPWARYGAWLGPVAGLLGLLTLVAAFRARKSAGLPRTRLLGFSLVGAAAAGLSSFMLCWGLGPF